MKKAALNSLVFKDFLLVCYEDLEPHLLKELNRLRTALILLPEQTQEKTLLAYFKKSVLNFNKINQDENIKNSIDTDEREGLCEVLYKMVAIVGLKAEEDFLDEWREW